MGIYRIEGKLFACIWVDQNRIKSMKVGIIGGTGLIGRELSGKLLADGNEVIVFSRGNSIPKNLDGLNQLQLVTCDIPKTQYLEGLDALVNLAGEPIIGSKWDESYKEKLRKSRVDFTHNLIWALKVIKKKPKVFLSASAIGYYGIFEDGEIQLTEKSPAGSDFLAKLGVDWELEAQNAEEFGIRTVLLRTGIVLSKEGGALKEMLPSFRMFVGGKISTGKQFMSWIHIDDLVRAIIYLMMDESAKGAFNLTAPNPVSNEEFSGALGTILGRPAFFAVPKFVLQALYGEGAEILVGGQNVYPARLSESGFYFKFPAIKDALVDLLKT